jgi:hypothetical protein
MIAFTGAKREVVDEADRLQPGESGGSLTQIRIEAPAARRAVALQLQVKRYGNGIIGIESKVQCERVLQASHHQHGGNNQDDR